MAEFPASTLIALDGLEDVDAARLAVLGNSRCRSVVCDAAVCRRAKWWWSMAQVTSARRLGISGADASALSKVVVSPEPLQALVEQGRVRVVSVVLTGDVAKDTAAIRAASGGGVDLGFDMVGHATDAESRRSPHCAACAGAAGWC